MERACFRGTAQHAPELADHLKARGLTMAGFLRDLLKKVYNVRMRGDYEELRRIMERRERAEGADDEGGEVGQTKFTVLVLVTLSKLGQKMLISNSRQSIGGRNHIIIMQSSNHNKLQT